MSRSEEPKRSYLTGRDGTLLTVGSVLGTGIFLVAGDLARALPDPRALLLVWVVGGAFTLAGAWSYAELGRRYPSAGGLYRYLAEAFGPLWGFLYGWTAFWAIMSGGIAALAVGTADYALGFAAPELAEAPELRAPLLAAVAVASILLLSTIKAWLPTAGWWTHHGLTLVKFLATAALAGALLALGREPVFSHTPPPDWEYLLGWGPALIAVLWTFDGFYAATFRTEDFEHPRKSVPRALLYGTLLLLGLYLFVQAGYLRALPIAQLAASSRPAQEAALAALGPGWSRTVSLLVAFSAFGCLSSTILYSAWIYPAMARDGLFLERLAFLGRAGTPALAIWLQSAWACGLAATGSFRALYTYVVFAGVLFHAAAGVAVLRLRPRPAIGTRLAALSFLGSCLLLLADTLRAQPLEALAGLGIVTTGLPAYRLWQRNRTPS